MLAALLRANIGEYQLRRVFPDRVPLTRKLLLATALVFLMLYEVLFGILAGAEDAAVVPWLFAGFFFVAYLLITRATFRKKG